MYVVLCLTVVCTVWRWGSSWWTSWQRWYKLGRRSAQVVLSWAKGAIVSIAALWPVCGLLKEIQRQRSAECFVCFILTLHVNCLSLLSQMWGIFAIFLLYFVLKVKLCSCKADLAYIVGNNNSSNKKLSYRQYSAMHETTIQGHSRSSIVPVDAAYMTSY